MVNRYVIEQHAEEAAFLWMQRDSAVLAPNYSLNDLADLDERVEANIDGLRVAGQVGLEISEEALGNEGPGEVFAASVLAFESKDTERIQKVLGAGCSDPKLERALISAIGWIPFDKVEDEVMKLVQNESSEIRRAGIAAFAAHRRDPGSALVQALSDANSRLRACALKAAGELGRKDLIPIISKCLSDTDYECRFFAAWSSARLGQRNSPVLTVLQEIAEEAGPYSEPAADISLRCMDMVSAKDWINKLKAVPKHLRLAAIGIGALGIPELINDIILFMENEEVARVAGESFSIITGIDLAYKDMEQDRPEGFKSGPSEDPEDEDVSMDKDEDLPWPAPELISQWWNDNRKNFSAGKRYILGKEISRYSLREVLRQGKQRQRAAAALELGILEPGSPIFEVRAPGKRQLKEIT